MKKFKNFLILSAAALILVNNIFLFSLTSKYENIDRIVKPTITLNKNKFGNSEGITINPTHIFSKKLKSKDQNNFRKMYLFLNIGIVLLIFMKRKTPDYYGTARFSDREEIDKMGITKNPEDGVVLGMTEDNKLITDSGVEHIINMAPTRTGKGINTVLPTLWTWKSSVIVNDIKGECWDLTSGYRRSILKQKCIFFNPMDDTGEGISYNPLELVKVGTKSEQEDSRAIAITLLDTDGKGESDHWISSAVNLLTAVILHTKYVNVNASFIDVMKFLEDPKEPLIDKIGAVIGKELNDYGDIVDKTKKDENGEIAKDENDEDIKIPPFNHYQSLRQQGINNLSFNELYMQDTTLHPLVGSTFATIFATPDKERGSIFSTCINKLSIFKDPRVMNNIKKSDVTPKDIMNNRISLYLITPPKAIKMTKPLFRLILTQTIYELTDKMEFNNRKKIDIEKKKKGMNLSEVQKSLNKFVYEEKVDYSKLKNKRILFLIDEFPALGNLSLFEEALAYIAGYGLKALLIVQSINQLNKIYGKDNSIIDNCRTQLYFTPNDKDTPKMISDMMGNKTEKIITRSGKGFFMENRSESYQARALMTAGEIRVLPYEKLLLLLSGKNPIKGNKIFWFKHKKFKDNADYNIPYPSYLRFVDNLINKGVTEYAAEYLIYLTKSYKALKVIIKEIGEENFINKILFNEKLDEKIKKVISLPAEEKIKWKEKVLKDFIKEKNYSSKEEYEKEFNEYLENFTDEDIERFLRTDFFKNQKELEAALNNNLEKIKKELNEKDQVKLKIIEHLKEKNILDSWIPQIPKTFIELILELEYDDKKIIEILDEVIEKEENTGGTIEFDFFKLENDLNNRKIKKEVDETTLEIEEL